MVRDPDVSDPVGQAPSGDDEVLVDEYGTQYYLAEDGSAYYLDEDGKPYYIAEDGNAYYFADDAVEADAVAESGAAPSTRRDPVVRFMSIGVALLTVVLLVGAGTIIWWLLQLSGAPRTAEERDIYTFQEAVKEAPKEQMNWLKLAYAYMESERWSEARDAIEDGRRLKDNTAFDLASADLLREQEKYEQAIQAYTLAEKAEKARLEQVRKEAEKKAITMPIDHGRLVEVLVGRAMCYEAVNKNAEALKDYRAAIEWEPMDAVILTSIGQLEAKAGNTAKAREAYLEATKYVPDYAEALKGLKELEGK